MSRPTFDVSPPAWLAGVPDKTVGELLCGKPNAPGRGFAVVSRVDGHPRISGVTCRDCRRRLVRLDEEGRVAFSPTPPSKR